MNDVTRQNTAWNNPSQAACAGCLPAQMNAPSAEIPFMSRGMQEMVEQGESRTRQRQPAFPAPAPTAMPGGMDESTSNYAALGLAPEAGVPSGSPQGILGSLVAPEGGVPSPTELPGLTAINLMNQQTAMNLQSLQYLNGFLLTQIGRSVTVTFLIGASSMDVRSGILVGVGANYILINEFESNDVVACDFYSIKFIKFYY